jgi:hypothetical protein
VFERFTERARQVIVLAQDEALALRHNYIGTEHILLGLLREEEGLAARVLESLDITLEEVRAMVARIVGQGDEVTTGQIPFTPRAKKVLELSMREALSLGHNYIGTEHVLLGLVRENDGVAARVLLDFDVDAETIRNELIRMLSGPQRRGDPLDWGELEAYRPSSPALTGEFAQELERLRNEIASALDEKDLERATGARQRFCAPRTGSSGARICVAERGCSGRASRQGRRLHGNAEAHPAESSDAMARRSPSDAAGHRNVRGHVASRDAHARLGPVRGRVRDRRRGGLADRALSRGPFGLVRCQSTGRVFHGH